MREKTEIKRKINAELILSPNLFFVLSLKVLDLSDPLASASSTMFSLLFN
jgi:hypothetical protein